MKIIWFSVVFLILAATNMVPLALDSAATNWAYLNAKSQLASNYLYENITAFR